MYKLVFSWSLLIKFLRDAQQGPSRFHLRRVQSTFSPSTRIGILRPCSQISVSDLFQKINDKQTLLIVDSRVDVQGAICQWAYSRAIPCH